MSKPDYIASDAHLGSGDRSRERAFVAFVEHVGAHGASLLINGDLFDFWFEYGEVIPGRHFRVLAALGALVDAGIPVTFVAGNHDAWGGRFLREEVGIDYHTGLLRTTLAGRAALVAHGDGLGTGDLRYRMLRTILRSRLVIGTFRAIHPEIGLRIARGVSRTETRADTETTRSRAAFLEAWGREQLAADSMLSYVICGHAHQPACVKVSEERFYLNAGDWLHHNTYIVVSPTADPLVVSWPDRR